MSSLLSIAANELSRREQPKLVAATGLLFKKLLDTTQKQALKTVLESYRGGAWGDEIAPGFGYPVLRSTNMRGKRVDVSEPAWCDVPASLAESCALRTGDILVTKSSGSSDLVGKAALFIQPANNQKYLFSNFILRLRPNQKMIMPEFLSWFLRSPQSLIWRYDAQQNAVGLRNLDTRIFLEQNIPVPSLALQEEITDYLNTLENSKARSVCMVPSLEKEQKTIARIEELAAKIEEARGLRRETETETEELILNSRALIFQEMSQKGTKPLRELAQLERGKFTHRPRNDPYFLEVIIPGFKLAK